MDENRDGFSKRITQAVYRSIQPYILEIKTQTIPVSRIRQCGIHHKRVALHVQLEE